MAILVEGCDPKNSKKKHYIGISPDGSSISLIWTPFVKLAITALILVLIEKFHCLKLVIAPGLSTCVQRFHVVYVICP